MRKWGKHCETLLVDFCAGALAFALAAAWACRSGALYQRSRDAARAALPGRRKGNFIRLEQDDPEAKQQLIVHNLRLVVYIARKFESSGLGVEDLISIGTIGLI